MEISSLSVVIPIYNSSKHIGQTINSVIDACADYKFEIILVDDMSDDVDAVLKQFEYYHNIRVIRKSKKTNASDSRNIGFLNSTFEMVFFLDSDDWFTSNYIKDRCALMERNCAGVYFGSFILSDANGNEKVMSKPYISSTNMRDYIFIEKGDFRSSTISINKKNHKGTLFDSLQYKHQDWGFGIRCFDAGEDIVYDDTSLVQINVGMNEQMSNSMNISASKYFVNTYLNDSRYHPSFVRKHYFNAFYKKDKIALEYFLFLIGKCSGNVKYMYMILSAIIMLKIDFFVTPLIKFVVKAKS